jgi:hypothetical protein
MDFPYIEKAARSLLADIYRDEQATRPGFLSPMQMIEPERVAAHLGYAFAEVPSLGGWGRGRARFEIAGLVDQQRRIISVSQRFRREVRRFTAAHEVGHVVLDHPGHVIHRDRPVFEVSDFEREMTEREADYFAACLLAPRRLLESEYSKRFDLGPPLPLTDAVAFNLCGESAHALMAAGRDSLRFACAVAAARHFNGRHFRSLSETFNISVGAMAIRLQELGLVEG